MIIINSCIKVEMEEERESMVERMMWSFLNWCVFDDGEGNGPN